MLLEIALRIAGPSGDWYAAGPQRQAFLEDHVERNSDRFRDREFSTTRSDKLRILAVGDSFTFGDSVENVDDVWPRVLQSQLENTEVYNLGIAGTNTAGQRNILRDRGYKYNPDRIVLAFVLNDPEPPDANTRIVPEILYPPLLPIGQPLDTGLTRLSYAYAFLRQKKNQLSERFGWKMTYGEFIASFYDPDGEYWQAFAAEARGLVADARSQGIEVDVAIFPMFNALDAYPFEQAHTMAAELFGSTGAGVIDLLPYYRQHADESLSISPTDAHPNERAHRIAAEVIAEHLKTRLAESANADSEAGESAGADSEAAEPAGTD